MKKTEEETCGIIAVSFSEAFSIISVRKFSLGVRVGDFVDTSQRALYHSLGQLPEGLAKPRVTQ